jgi:hypothetical protein
LGVAPRRGLDDVGRRRAAGLGALRRMSAGARSGPQSTRGRMAQPAVGTPIPVGDLADQDGVGPVDTAGLVAGDGGGRSRALQQVKSALQVVEHGGGEPASDAAGVGQLTGCRVAGVQSGWSAIP